MSGLDPLTIFPPITFPLTDVYSIISFSISAYPILVVPTPTFSKVENDEALSTVIGDVDDASY